MEPKICSSVEYELRVTNVVIVLYLDVINLLLLLLLFVVEMCVQTTTRLLRAQRDEEAVRVAALLLAPFVARDLRE